MATYKSTQETKRQATPPKALDTTDLKGRIRVAYFDFTVPVGNAAADTTIDLTTLPAGARLLGGKIAAEAMSTGGAAASIRIGTSASDAKYLGDTSIDAAAQAEFGHTAALNYGEKLTVETTLMATVKTEAWLAGKVLRGHANYVLD